jgi:hypothetical protein
MRSSDPLEKRRAGPFDKRRAGPAASLALLALAGCGSGGGGSTVGGTHVADANVMALSIDGAQCTIVSGYPNKPCVQLRVCVPGTAQCQIVKDILLDTGSFGLRVFRQALGSLALPQVTVGPDALASCVQFADQTSDWGPVQLADVVLGNEPAVRTPIHVLDATFPGAPSSCPSPETGPFAAGFNGILGVGVFLQDCGPGCAATAQNGIYYSCATGSCTGTTVPLQDQVQNPVALLPQDNNGVIVDLPAVGDGGAGAVEGTLLLGIGTQSNNTLAGATTYPVSPSNGTFDTTLEGHLLTRSFLDTGSNGLFFAPPSGGVLPACPGGSSSWLCPATTVSMVASNTGDGGSPTVDVPFKIANFESLQASGNVVFSDLGGGALAGAGFDWGIPFYLGRRVAVGFEGRRSSLGTGPLVAY